MKQILPALSGLCLALPPAVGHAQDLTFGEPFELDEIVVETGQIALTGQPISRVGATVEVLDFQDEPGAEASSLARRLDLLPGVSFSSNGGVGAQSTLRLRGLGAPYIGVRIDGIDVTDPSATQTLFNFGGLTGAGIGRVEVIKGSQSALYGSEAIGGVVDIRSARGETLGFSGDLSVAGGSFETFSGAARLSQVTEFGQIDFNINRIVTEGFSARSSDEEEDGFAQTFATLTGDFAVSETVTLGFSALWRDADLEIDRSSTDSSGENFTEEAGARAYARIDAAGILHELSYSAFSTDRRDPEGFTTAFDGDRRELAYLGTTELGSTTLSFGADWTEETARTDSISAEDEIVSVFGEAIFRPTDTLDLALSLRHDDSDDFGGQTSGRLAAAWQAGPNTILRAMAGTGFRAPSLFERFSSFGDPELEAEESLSFELGIEQRIGVQGFVRATAFYTEIDNLIEFDGAATTCGSGFGCYAQVPGTTRTQGIELSGRYGFAEDRAAVFGSYTYTDAETEEGRLARVPRHDLVLGVEGALANRLTGSFDIQFVGDVEPSPFAPADNKVGDYTLANFQLTYALTDTVDATLRVENLFDEDYETAGGFNQPGRAAYVALATSF